MTGHPAPYTDARETIQGETTVNTLPTPEAITAEIAALQAIKPRVLHYTLFGDDNHVAIDVQIEFLMDPDPEEAINDYDIENDEHIYFAASAALEWLAVTATNPRPSTGPNWSTTDPPSEMHPVNHPASYTDALLPIMAGLLPAGPVRILDPFCGTGKIARLSQWLPQAELLRLRNRKGMGRPGAPVRLSLYHRRLPQYGVCRCHLRRDLYQPHLRQPHGRSSRRARTLQTLPRQRLVVRVA